MKQYNFQIQALKRQMATQTITNDALSRLQFINGIWLNLVAKSSMLILQHCIHLSKVAPPPMQVVENHEMDWSLSRH